MRIRRHLASQFLLTFLTILKPFAYQTSSYKPPLDCHLQLQYILHLRANQSEAKNSAMKIATIISVPYHDLRLQPELAVIFSISLLMIAVLWLD